MVDTVSLYEYQNQLYNVYSSLEIKNGVELEECIWIEDNYKTVLWLDSNNIVVSILKWYSEKISF